MKNPQEYLKLAEAQLTEQPLDAYRYPSPVQIATRALELAIAEAAAVGEEQRENKPTTVRAGLDRASVGARPFERHRGTRLDELAANDADDVIGARRYDPTQARPRVELVLDFLQLVSEGSAEVRLLKVGATFDLDRDAFVSAGSVEEGLRRLLQTIEGQVERRGEVIFYHERPTPTQPFSARFEYTPRPL